MARMLSVTRPLSKYLALKPVYIAILSAGMRTTAALRSDDRKLLPDDVDSDHDNDKALEEDSEYGSIVERLEQRPAAMMPEDFFAPLSLAEVIANAVSDDEDENEDIIGMAIANMSYEFPFKKEGAEKKVPEVQHGEETNEKATVNENSTNIEPADKVHEGSSEN